MRTKNEDRSVVHEGKVRINEHMRELKRIRDYSRRNSTNISFLPDLIDLVGELLWKFHLTRHDFAPRRRAAEGLEKHRLGCDESSCGMVIQLTNCIEDITVQQPQERLAYVARHLRRTVLTGVVALNLWQYRSGGKQSLPMSAKGRAQPSAPAQTPDIQIATGGNCRSRVTPALLAGMTV